MNITQINPQQHDEAMAAKFHELDRASQKVVWAKDTIMRMVGFKKVYQSVNGWFDASLKAQSFENALEVLGTLDPTERNMKIGRTPAQALAEWGDAIKMQGDILLDIKELEQAYTGWSRFFLVTSSSGHIHSSRACTTCYPTTTFGWMPHLSGKEEKDAVEACGPSLCSVCFPNAPVDWQKGRKLTKAQAAKLAA